MLVELAEPRDARLVERALAHVVEHHDALGMRFERDESGWRQLGGRPGEEPLFTRVELAALTAEERTRTCSRQAQDLQAGLDLTSGPLIRAAVFDYGPSQPARLLLAVHHLVIDWVSWRILLDDLDTALRQLGRGEPVALPAKTTSFQEWAVRQAEYAVTDAARRELGYWLAQASDAVAELPVDFPGGTDTEASTRTVVVALDSEATRMLLHDSYAAYRAKVTDLLLAALAQTLGPWIGARSVLVGLEGHGREPLFDGVDLSRTVGWFTTLFPVRLHLAADASPAAAIEAIGNQMRALPRSGIGYGILRYLSRDAAVARELRALPRSQITFNYLGRLDSRRRLSVLPNEDVGPTRGPRNRRPWLIDISAYVLAGQLRVVWSYSADAYRAETVRRLADTYADRLRTLIGGTLIGEARSTAAGRVTASGSPDTGLSQVELEELVEELKHDVEREQP
jgi:non-ribosomal peptide synthase protein (TIGR01720 family)